MAPGLSPMGGRGNDPSPARQLTSSASRIVTRSSPENPYRGRLSDGRKLVASQRCNTEVRLTQCWRKRDSNPRSGRTTPRSNRRSDPPKSPKNLASVESGPATVKTPLCGCRAVREVSMQNLFQLRVSAVELPPPDHRHRSDREAVKRLAQGVSADHSRRARAEKTFLARRAGGGALMTVLVPPASRRRASARQRATLHPFLRKCQGNGARRSSSAAVHRLQ